MPSGMSCEVSTGIHDVGLCSGLSEAEVANTECLSARKWGCIIGPSHSLYPLSDSKPASLSCEVSVCLDKSWGTDCRGTEVTETG